MDQLVYHYMGSHDMITLTMERPLDAQLIMLKIIIRAKLPAVAAVALASGR